MKTIVKIFVQGSDQSAEQFATALTKWMEQNKIVAPSMQFTSTTNGRQTCNIWYMEQK